MAQDLLENFNLTKHGGTNQTDDFLSEIYTAYANSKLVKLLTAEALIKNSEDPMIKNLKGRRNQDI